MKKYLFILILFPACKKQNVQRPAPSVFRDVFFTAQELARSPIHFITELNPKTFHSPHAKLDKVLYLDFDGYWLDTATWLIASGLNEQEQRAVYDTVVKKFAQFKKLEISTNEEDYIRADPLSRQRVVITETWEPFGDRYGGIAWIRSFSTGESAAFVFSSNMYWDVGFIGRAIAHEAGHTLGLYHQTDTHTDQSGACVLDKVYGRNKLMGWSYDPASEWVVGHPHYGFEDPCAFWQDDEKTITAILRK